MPIRIRLIAAVMMCIGFSERACFGDDPPKTGAFQLKIEQRSDESAIPKILTRMGWGTMENVRKTKAEEDYDLSKESFEAFVPPAYDGKEAYGLFVWISPGPSGSPPKEWIDVLTKHKLIWVGPNHADNGRAVWIRMGLAIDAAQHFRQTYSIDEKRVYISGLSGGGRSASRLGIAYPDVFTGGGCYMIGCDFYRNVPFPGPGNKFYPKSYARPKPEMMKLTQTARRHVLLTGDTDQNKDQTKANFEAAKADGFKHATYIQVPGMGHTSPDAEHFEGAIETLDDPKAMNGRGKVEKPKPKPAKEKHDPHDPQAIETLIEMPT